MILYFLQNLIYRVLVAIRHNFLIAGWWVFDCSCFLKMHFLTYLRWIKQPEWPKSAIWLEMTWQFVVSISNLSRLVFAPLMSKCEGKWNKCKESVAMGFGRSSGSIARAESRNRKSKFLITVFVVNFINDSLVLQHINRHFIKRTFSKTTFQWDKSYDTTSKGHFFKRPFNKDKSNYISTKANKGTLPWMTFQYRQLKSLYQKETFTNDRSSKRQINKRLIKCSNVKSKKIYKGKAEQNDTSNIGQFLGQFNI